MNIKSINMNIDNLTIKDAREIAAIFQAQGSKAMLQKYVGKYVICRSYNEGVNAGYVKELDDTGVVLTNVRRLWKHYPKNNDLCWYEGVSVSGLSESSEISSTADEKVIMEKYSLTICSKEG